MNFQEPPWKRFEYLSRKILEGNDFKIKTHSPQGDYGFDFLGTFENKIWAIEIKYYRTARARLSLIESAASRVVVNGIGRNADNGMLIVSSVLPLETRKALQNKFNIVFIDRIDLRIWASSYPELLDELDSLLELHPDFAEDQSIQRLILNNDQKLLKEKPLPKVDIRGTELCENLKLIKRGKTHWAQYEAICAEILQYLFPNDLRGWHKQKSTDGGASRYDFVCRVSPSSEFWKFLVDNLNSRYIIFEFKNYSTKIKQGQILTTEKYLLERGLRRVAIIFTRLGSDKNALSMMQGAMREHGKLILSLDDDIVCKMLHMKEKGDDPTDLLFELTDNFLLSLPR